MGKLGFRIFVVLCVLGAGVTARSLTLEEAQQIADEKSPKIAQMRASESSAKWQRSKAFSTFIPKISLQAQYLFSEKFQTLPVNLGTSPVPTNTEILMIQPYTLLSGRATWNLFEGGQGLRNYQAASLNHEASSLERERAETQLQKDVRTQFYKALGAQSLFEVSVQKVRALEEHQQDVRRRLNAGTGTRYDLLKVETQLADAESDKMQAEDDVVLTRTALASLLGEEDLPSDLLGKFPDIEKIQLPEDLKPEAEARTDIAAKMKRDEAALKQIQASRGWWFPRVSVFGEKQFYNNIDHDWQYSSKLKDAYSLGLQLQWDIFDGGISYSQQMQSKYDAIIARENVRAARIQFPQEIDRWKRRFKLSVSVYKSKLLSVTKSEETVRLARQGVRAGTLTNTDLLDAELELYTSKASRVQAQVNAIEALGNLELATGKILY